MNLDGTRQVPEAEKVRKGATFKGRSMLKPGVRQFRKLIMLTSITVLGVVVVMMMMMMIMMMMMMMMMMLMVVQT